MQLNEAKAFEIIGRLHAENRLLADEVAALKAQIEILKGQVEAAKAKTKASA